MKYIFEFYNDIDTDKVINIQEYISIGSYAHIVTNWPDGDYCNDDRKFRTMIEKHYPEELI